MVARPSKITVTMTMVSLMSRSPGLPVSSETGKDIFLRRDVALGALEPPRFGAT